VAGDEAPTTNGNLQTSDSEAISQDSTAATATDVVVTSPADQDATAITDLVTSNDSASASNVTPGTNTLQTTNEDGKTSETSGPPYQTASEAATQEDKVTTMETRVRFLLRHEAKLDLRKWSKSLWWGRLGSTTPRINLNQSVGYPKVQGHHDGGTIEPRDSRNQA